MSDQTFMKIKDLKKYGLPLDYSDLKVFGDVKITKIYVVVSQVNDEEEVQSLRMEMGFDLEIGVMEFPLGTVLPYRENGI